MSEQDTDPCVHCEKRPLRGERGTRDHGEDSCGDPLLVLQRIEALAAATPLAHRPTKGILRYRVYASLGYTVAALWMATKK